MDGWLISKTEADLLFDLPLAARVIYVFGMRPHMDVKTQIVGGSRRRISYDSLRELLQFEFNRKLSEKPTKHFVRAALAQLERTGLIERLKRSERDHEHLVFLMPFSLLPKFVQNNNRTTTAQDNRTTTAQHEASNLAGSFGIETGNNRTHETGNNRIHQISDNTNINNLSLNLISTNKHIQCKKLKKQNSIDCFEPSESTIAWWHRYRDEKNFPGQLSDYVEFFIDYCRSKNPKYKDYQAALKNCIRSNWPRIAEQRKSKAEQLRDAITSKDFISDEELDRSERKVIKWPK